ncbi:DEAD/DEAH box helicase family protein [Castellaniella sp. GW247-6E4]|uniref:DEAD/DEAH box helicase n=1 Tax=Castellaniella sp. GW247-6E4 TaxID=3140380 RepID=UPI00331646E4
MRERPEGGYQWKSHRLLEEFDAMVMRDGWSRVAREITGSWIGRLSFRSEIKQQDGTVQPGQEGLRPPQLGALHAIGAHWSLEHQPATVVMPTGTGKTETMLATLAAFGKAPLLVVVPWDSLRTQTVHKFLTFGLLRKLKVLPEVVQNPIVGIINRRPQTIEDLELVDACNVVVVTASAIGVGTESAILDALAQKCGALILDEAHHVPATNWSRVREAFKNVPILQFTATPFRRDGKLVDGKVIFNYPLGHAQRDGYFKPIRFEPVYEVRGAAWADQVIAKVAIQQLREDLAAGYDHLLMARCENIGRAEVVEQIYRKLAPDLEPLLIHSESHGADTKIEELKAGRSKIAVCVNMLGEGFDLPSLKVAAVHDMHRSLAILLQFTGRFTRVAGKNIGDATVVANIADSRVSGALERLYSEDADWNKLLSELSSEAAQEHAELIEFLQSSQRLDKSADDEVSISHQLLRPIFSTVAYRVAKFAPARFHNGLGKDRHVHAVWLHEQTKTLYFVTRKEPRLRWMQSKEVRDREWALFVLHHDEDAGLLFLSSTDHGSMFQELAQAVSDEVALISGEQVFRSLGRINRLMFHSLGVKKHGRRNLSFAMYTGADVAEALGVSERAGSVKNNVSGTGWEGGSKIAIGCSYKGRVWSREQGSIPSLVRWCKAVGSKLVDDTINVANIIANVLIPEEVDRLPDATVLAVEWPAELLGISEERVVFTVGNEEWPLYLLDLKLREREGNVVQFVLGTDDYPEFAAFALTIGGEHGFQVRQTEGDVLSIKIGNHDYRASEYFSFYPPLIRFVDLSELDGNLLIKPQDPRELALNEKQFEVWDWQGVDMTVESLWRNGQVCRNSIQWKAAQHFVHGGFDVVFDDDGAGEAADLVCLKEEPDRIRLVLIHCKFSGGSTPGERVKDVVEVCSQAVRSAKWKWRFRDLGQHINSRNLKLANTAVRTSRFLAGSSVELNNIVKAYRFKRVDAEILVVQPGLSLENRTADQNMVIAAAATFLKETIGCDLGVICSA